MDFRQQPQQTSLEIENYQQWHAVVDLLELLRPIKTQEHFFFVIFYFMFEEVKSENGAGCSGESYDTSFEHLVQRVGKISCLSTYQLPPLSSGAAGAPQFCNFTKNIKWSPDGTCLCVLFDLTTL